MIPIVGVSLEEALLGFGDDGGNLGEKTIASNGIYLPSDDNLDGYSKVTVNVPSGITVADIIANGYPLYQAPITVGAGTAIESTLSAYKVNFYYVRQPMQGDQVINIGNGNTGWKDNFFSYQDYWFRLYGVYYVNNVPTWAQEYSPGFRPRDLYQYTYYTWNPTGTGTDFEYAILISNTNIVDTELLTSGIYDLSFSLNPISSGYIQLSPYSTGKSYFEMTVNNTSYYYTTHSDSAPTPNGSREYTSKLSASQRFYFPYTEQNVREAQELICDTMTRSDLQDMFLDISALIYQYYLST